MKLKFTPDKLMIGLFSVIMAAIVIATIVQPKAEVSENENRTLAKFPTVFDTAKAEDATNFLSTIKWKYIADRNGNAFKDDFEAYLCDHIVGRETWVKACNTMQRLSGKKEINGIYTVGEQMVQTFTEYDEDAVNASIKAMNAFSAKFPEKRFYFMLAPTSQEIFDAKIPRYVGTISERSFIDDTYGKLQGITPIDCRSALAFNSDEYIYYRTDHHWTSLGAFYAYRSAAEVLGYSAYQLNSFNIEAASSGFRGSLYSRTLDDSIAPDTIDYYFLADGEPNVKMTCIDNGKTNVYDSLYVRDFLETKDKYSGFTGRNVPVVTIETDVDTDRSLLIIKDSYAHSLVPFLSKHYSKITMLDIRYINTDISRIVKLDEYQQVMFMYNSITFAEDRNLTKLALTR